jgi:hypothetical protein
MEIGRGLYSLRMAHARAYAPASLNAADFSAIEPHYRELLGRAISSADELEQLILDRSDLDSLVAEKAANLYIATTRNTEDKTAEAAFLGFVRDVEPKLKPLSSELDKKTATSAFADALPKARYEVLLRGMRVDIELFREANIPLETELAELDQKYNQIVGRMTVEFDGKTLTMPQMSRFLEETDRAIRERAWKAIADRRLADRRPLGRRRPRGRLPAAGQQSGKAEGGGGAHDYRGELGSIAQFGDEDQGEGLPDHGPGCGDRMADFSGVHSRFGVIGFVLGRVGPHRLGVDEQLETEAQEQGSGQPGHQARWQQFPQAIAQA